MFATLNQRKQISIQFILAITTVVALVLFATQFIAQFPFLVATIALIAALLAITGGLIIVFALLIAFSILASPREADRARELKKCMRMALVGIAATLPVVLLLLIAIFYFLF